MTFFFFRLPKAISQFHPGCQLPEGEMLHFSVKSSDNVIGTKAQGSKWKAAPVQSNDVHR